MRIREESPLALRNGKVQLSNFIPKCIKTNEQIVVSLFPPEKEAHGQTCSEQHGQR